MQLLDMNLLVALDALLGEGSVVGRCTADEPQPDGDVCLA